LGSRSVRVGLVGIGNCASAFVQGLQHYSRAGAQAPGLMTGSIGPYCVGDVVVVSAFDVTSAKVGRDLADAVFAAPNNTVRFAEVPPLGLRVHRGPTQDGLGRYLRSELQESDAPVEDVAAILRQSRTEVLVSYLPVGSQGATEWYAEQALAAGCAFVNCIPVFIASDRDWQERFAAARLPLLGDDIKSQVGATIVHRVLTNLFRERGVRLDRSYQLNFGGNSDFLNMLERERVENKKISKTRAVASQMDAPLPEGDLHIGPSDFVPWLADRKFAHIRMEGVGFGGVPLTLELKLEVWDSPNSAGIVIDAVRCAKLALDRGIGGPLIGPASYFMKSPPAQFTDAEARARTLEFIGGQG